MKDTSTRIWVLGVTSTLALALLFGFQNCAPVLPLDGVVDDSSLAVRATATPGPTPFGSIGSGDPFNGNSNDGICYYDSTQDPMAVAGTDAAGGVLIGFQNSDGRAALWNIFNGQVSRGVVCKLSGYSLAAIGDFDGDLNADVLWRNPSGAMVLWLMRGASRIATGSFPMVASPTMSLEGVADVNRDGKADLIWRDSSAGGKVFVTYMKGLQAPTNGAMFDLPAGHHIMSVGDFNGDRFPDLLTIDALGAPFATFSLDVPGSVTTQAFAPAFTADGSVVGTGYFNGDLTTDLLVKRADGTMVLRYVAGTAFGGESTPLAALENVWLYQFMQDINGGLTEGLYVKADTAGNFLGYVSYTPYVRSAFPTPIQTGYTLFKYPHL